MVRICHIIEALVVTGVTTCLGCGPGFLGDGSTSEDETTNSESSTDEWSTTDPSTTDPRTTDPSTTDPSTTDPSTTDPSTTSGPIDMEPQTCEPVEFLPFRPLDVEYDELRDQLVMVTGSPNELRLYNPDTHEELVYELPRTPTSVSIGPDQLAVAVGHDALITVLDIEAGTTEVLDISTDVFDVVLAGNGWVYAFPGSGQWTEIHGVEIESGMEQLSGFPSIRQNTRAKLRPGSATIYGADNGLSPSDIERYDISLGVPSVLYDSPYHGDYAMCGDLWLSDDGGRIFTRCGNTFRATDDQDDDMTYAGSLENLDRIEHLDHSEAAGLVAAIPETNEGWGDEPGTEDTEIRLFDDQFIGFDSAISLPLGETPDGCFPLHGRFVFFDSSGTSIHVLAQLDPDAGALLDYTLLTFPL